MLKRGKNCFHIQVFTLVLREKLGKYKEDDVHLTFLLFIVFRVLQIDYNFLFVLIFLMLVLVPLTFRKSNLTELDTWLRLLFLRSPVCVFHYEKYIFVFVLVFCLDLGMFIL